MRMTHIVSEVTAYDRKRQKVTLDEGDVTFLLYNGETARSGVDMAAFLRGETVFLSGEDLQRIFQEILLPRAKKRCLYYLKNGDRTEAQIKRKLREGFYPEPVVEETLSFLRRTHFADDSRFAENLSESLKETKSRREIAAKLYEKGVPKEISDRILSEITEEDEFRSCEKALRKKCTGDRRKDLAYLLRKGYSYEACEQAFCALADQYSKEEEY